jgi:2,4-dienoyl-CoA reductase-like NADH-dependent reductase (Old Yellow Enzyme family)
MAEASAVTAEGRISPSDLGIWKDEHIPQLARIADFIHRQGALPGIQIAHAGRKGSTAAPWEGGKLISEANGGWKPVAASAVAFADGYAVPKELTLAQIAEVVEAFAASTRRALDAGFEVVEIHAAHGYLIHEFLSPLSNFRKDEYGGPLENRMRFAKEVAETVRAEWPASQPLFVRISATDWAEGGWEIEQSVALARELQKLDVDLIDCSSGGLAANAKIPQEAGYQVDFARRIKEETGLLTGAVGLISQPRQADEIISTGRADVVLMAREFLRDPYWPLHTANEFGFSAEWPAQYLRAAPPGSVARKEIYRGGTPSTPAKSATAAHVTQVVQTKKSST